MVDRRFTFNFDLYSYLCYALGIFQLGGFFPGLIVRPFYEAGRYHVALFYTSPLLDLAYAFDLFPPAWLFDVARGGMALTYLGIGYGVRHRRSPVAWKAGQTLMGANLVLMPAQRMLRSASVLDAISLGYVVLMAAGLYLARLGTERMRQIEGERRS